MKFLLSLLAYGCVAIIVIFGILVTVGFAAGGKGNELRPHQASAMTQLLAEQCSIIGQVAYQAGIARDKGQSSAGLKHYVRTHSDTQLESDVENAIDMPYRSELRSMSPGEVATVARNNCINNHTGER